LSIYDKFEKGDLKGSLEAQYKLNPIRLEMDKSSFPVATKDYANLMGNDVGLPFLPNKKSPEHEMENLKNQLKSAGYLK